MSRGNGKRSKNAADHGSGLSGTAHKAEATAPAAPANQPALETNGSSNGTGRKGYLSYDVFKIPSSVDSLTLVDAINAKIIGAGGFLDTLVQHPELNSIAELAGISSAAWGAALALEEAHMMVNALHDRHKALDDVLSQLRAVVSERQEG